MASDGSICQTNCWRAYVGVQACRSLIYLNTHSSIRARSTFTSSFTLSLFIFSSSSSSSITFLSVPLVLSCCPCHCSSCSVITRSHHSTFLRSTVVVKMEGLTSGLWSQVTWSGHTSSPCILCVSGLFLENPLVRAFSVCLLFLGFSANFCRSETVTDQVQVKTRQRRRRFRHS